MKAFTSDLVTLIESATVEGLARAFTITRKDGVVKRFAETVTDIVLDGQTYSANVSLIVGSYANAMNEEASEIDIEMVAFAGGPIAFTDVQDGLYNGSEIEIFLFDRDTPANANPTSNLLFWGKLSAATFTNLGHAQFTAKGPLAEAGKIVNRKYAGSCDAHFADADGANLCKIDPDTVTETGTIVSMDDRTLVVSGLSNPTDYYNLGRTKFTSGRLKNRIREIQTSTLSGNTTIVLFASYGINAQVGDTLEVKAGCSFDVDPASRVVLTGCRRWNNILNYRGFPYMDDDATVANNTTDFEGV